MTLQTTAEITLICAIGILSVAYCIYPRIRPWLLAIVIGILYWLALEAMCYAGEHWLNLQASDGYLVGATLTLVILAIWLARIEKEKIKGSTCVLTEQVEHTPVNAEQWRRISRRAI